MMFTARTTPRVQGRKGRGIAKRVRRELAARGETSSASVSRARQTETRGRGPVLSSTKERLAVSAVVRGMEGRGEEARAVLWGGSTHPSIGSPWLQLSEPAQCPDLNAGAWV